MQKKTHCPQKAASMAGTEASAALRPAPAAWVRVGGPAARWGLTLGTTFRWQRKTEGAL